MQVDADQLREFAAEFVSRRTATQEQLLPLLQDLAKRYGGVPHEAVKIAADLLNLSVAEVAGVISFYADFRTGNGPQNVEVCCAEACQALGAGGLYEVLAGQGGVSVRKVYCLGNCAAAPSARVGDKVIGRADVQRVMRELSVS